MFSFWLNFQNSGNQDTFGYHFVNVAAASVQWGVVLLTVARL